jgi:alkylation response protein AidB-like acyl-CoA dehydrogenase
MQVYNAPIRDMRFVMHELHNSAAHVAEIGAPDVTAELMDSILEEAGKFAKDILLPINASGDEEGCKLENGVVRTPAGFVDAYKKFCQAGWGGLSSPTEYGGQGLPEILGKMVEEMQCSANLSFGLYPGLTHGATLALEGHGSEELKRRYLPKMIDGTWSGTMCLTEAQCGTDLGMMRTKAIPQADGSFKISGAKIFISAGEHDLTENIIHLVLARIEGAPKGIKGVSMFLVPKFIPSEDGRPGARNGVTCTAIEHKMGLKASATTQLYFDDATGWLVGESEKGMRAMFTMMNAERLSVGIQGLGVAETAYQSAAFYAKDRLQGRSLTGAKYPEKAADPIIVHPDVRRTLMTVRAYVEGCRALSGWVATALDLETKATDPVRRQEAEDFVAIMTPVVKALFTDLGFELSSMALQVYGGHGYIRDHGMEQLVRDARICMIYEGANGIQALDLVGRKMPAHMGRFLRGFFHPVQNFIEENSADPKILPLAKSFAALQQATAHLAAVSQKDPEEAGAAATDYLRLMGLVALGFMWAKTAKVAEAKLPEANGDAGFYKAKLTTAQFFADRLLPQTGALWSAIKAGKGSMMELEEAAF